MTTYDYLAYDYDDDDFILGEELLKKWSKYKLLHSLHTERRKLLLKNYFQKLNEKGKLEDVPTSYYFQPWNPANRKPIVIDESLRWDNINADKAEDLIAVPAFDKHFLPYLEKCYYLKKDVEWMEKDHPSLKNEDERLIVRKAVALEVAKIYKKQNLTQKEAAININAYLKDNDLAPYSVKHLTRIISHLGFSPGKPGRKPKK